ncbi:hypothetical protein [Streptomyces sp. NPDC048644]|uniref:hypothetical protein n=1 Tax=Streptomyces sp. NPDC048644 TaxID=3365582 RepID=UPI003722BECE
MTQQNLPDLPNHHRQLFTGILDLGLPCRLALRGNYTVRAHGIVHRPGQSLDFTAIHPADLADFTVNSSMV